MRRDAVPRKPKTEQQKRKEHNYNHPINRALWRYGINFHDEERARVLGLIHNNEAVCLGELSGTFFILPNGRAVSAHNPHRTAWIVPVETGDAIIIYDKKQDRIVTFLPSWDGLTPTAAKNRALEQRRQ